MKQYAVVVLSGSPSLKIASFERESEIIDYTDFCNLKSLCETEIDLWEIVNCQYLSDFIMLVAEDGKLRGLRDNLFASFLYGAIPFDYIAGDCVIVHRHETQSDEMRWLTEIEVQRITDTFRETKFCRVETPIDS